jgi:hypothetical protein
MISNRALTNFTADERIIHQSILNHPATLFYSLLPIPPNEHPDANRNPDENRDAESEYPAICARHGNSTSEGGSDGESYQLC